MKRKRRTRPELGSPGSGLLLGVLMGLGFGIGLAAWVTVVRLLGGESTFADLQTSYPRVVAVYLVCGPLVGALAGFLGRWVRGRGSAVALGVLVAIPFALGIRLARMGFDPWTIADTLTLGFFSVGLGGYVGYGMWRLLGGE